jgi:hypothetical protein
MGEYLLLGLLEAPALNPAPEAVKLLAGEPEVAAKAPARLALDP